jgi:hypothetical protein
MIQEIAATFTEASFTIIYETGDLYFTVNENENVDQYPDYMHIISTQRCTLEGNTKIYIRRTGQKNVNFYLLAQD